MNGFEEIQEIIKSFIFEQQQKCEQITKIEQQRLQLAQQRNEKKKSNINDIEINQLGIEISELGNQSQELQNKLDFRFREIKSQICTSIDNLVAEGIRKICKINEEITELENKIRKLEEKQEKYELQKQEFYVRFGRMPELSEEAKQEYKHQEESKSTLTIDFKDEYKISVASSTATDIEKNLNISEITF